MTSQKKENPWTLRTVRFEAGVLQVGTASSSTVVSTPVNLTPQTKLGKNNSKSL